MTQRTYGQPCALARSLDVLGERWTILVVRELLLGPRRFKHLLSALPAIGSNRLSDRLKALEAADVVQRTELPPPADVQAYALTDRGEALRGPLLGLALWGLELPAHDGPTSTPVRSELLALTLTSTQTRPADPRRRGSVEFHIGDEVFHLALREGRYLARSGPAATEPAARVVCDQAAFVALARRTTTPAEAVRVGRASVVSGSRAAFGEVFRVLGDERKATRA